MYMFHMKPFLRQFDSFARFNLSPTLSEGSPPCFIIVNGMLSFGFSDGGGMDEPYLNRVALTRLRAVMMPTAA